MGRLPKDIAAMRASGQAAARILEKVEAAVSPGVTTRMLDDIARQGITEERVRPAFLGYDHFPAVICTSVNSVAVHGVPDGVALKEGDVLGLDFGIVKDAWYSDLAVTVPVGNVSKEAARLIRVCREALEKGILACRADAHIGDVSSAIQEYVERAGFRVICELVGHGIGRKLHEPPHVPNFGKRGTGEVLEEGMTIAIEPIIAVADEHVALDADQFSWRTKGRSLAAHFEHTVVIRKNGAEILTLP